MMDEPSDRLINIFGALYCASWREQITDGGRPSLVAGF